jgi:diaminopimelate epimerase
VPHGEREIATGRNSSTAYVARAVEGWYQVERHQSLTWVWAEQGGEIEVRCGPGVSALATIELTVRSVTSRDFTVRQHGAPRLTATIEDRLRTFTIQNVQMENGVARLRLETTADAVPENTDGGGRKLGLMLYRVRLLDF